MAIALAACSGTTPSSDAGVDAGAFADASTRLPDLDWLEEGVPPVDIPWLEAGEPPIEAPRIPWLDAGVPPIEWPCPEGWRQVDDPSGVSLCEPYPEGGRQECEAGEFHPPGEPGCRPLGAACGEGPFAALG
ncbi:MAG: hypothetical protein AAGH15_20760, partial [Myxococcota bacterium]